MCLCVFSFSQFCTEATQEVNETQQHPANVYHDMGLTRNKIVTAQFECYQKIMKDNIGHRNGRSHDSPTGLLV